MIAAAAPVRGGPFVLGRLLAFGGPLGRALATLLLCVGVAGSLVGDVAAQQTVDVDGVLFRFHAEDAYGLSGVGYTEIPVVVQNPGEDVRRVELRLGSATGDRWIDAGASVSASLAPGESRELVLLLPGFAADPIGSTPVECVVDGNETARIMTSVLHDQWCEQTYFVRVFSDRALGAGWQQQRGAELSGAQPQRFVGPFEKEAFREPCPRWYPDGPVWRSGRPLRDAMVERRRDTRLKSLTSTYSVALHPTARLPRSFAGLTSCDVVVLDGGGVDEAGLAEVARWVRLGGTVVCARAGVFASFGELETARRPENRMVTFGDVVVASYGLGHVVLAPGDPLGSEEQRLALWWIRERNPSWFAPLARASGGANTPLRWRMGHVALPGLGEISHRTILALLIVLALVVGPLNMWIVRRGRRPVAFLFTVPVIALVGTLVVVAYGVARDGIGVKDAVRSWAVLDQEADTVSSCTYRALFLGLSDGRRLRPGSGTVVLPLERPTGDTGGDHYRVDRDADRGTVTYSGAFLAVRRPLLQAVHVDHSTRARLVAERRDGAVHVDNALGAPIVELWLRDRDGILWHAAERIEDGAGRQLAAVEGDEEALRDFLNALAPGPYLHPFVELQPGSYAAHVDGVVGEDDCQVSGTRILQEQSLIGRFEKDVL